MKAWGWISMRRSLKDAVKNAFEETTMKNVPIDQFQSFKWRNGVWNWNLREKLSKISPFGNFDFWSKVNAKSQSQLILGQSQRSVLTGQIRVVQVGSVWVNGQLGDVVLTRRHCWRGKLTCLMTWTRADVDVLAWLLTWSDDVIWWCQMTSAAVSVRGRSVQCSPVRGGEARNPGGAWWRVQRCMTTRFSGQVDRWTTRSSLRHVWLRSKLGVENLRWCVWEFQEPLSMRGGACGCLWRSGSWVLVAICHGAGLSSWFH